MNDNTAGLLLLVLFIAFVGYVCWVASRKET
jgi:hypothetical protein